MHFFSSSHSLQPCFGLPAVAGLSANIGYIFVVLTLIFLLIALFARGSMSPPI